MATEVHDAKEAGNKAFKEGDNEEAVKCYTEAIEDEPSDHVLYSNRSAAYAKLSKFKEALLDANKCIGLKPDWFRGHSRRGAAYMGLKSYRAALGAFDEGLKLDPTNAYMLEEAARMRKILDGANGNTMGSSSGGSGPPPTASAPKGTISNFHGIISIHVLFFTLFYVLPIFPARALMSYRIAIAFSMALLLNALNAVWPKTMATLKNPAFLKSEEIQALMLCFMMLVSPPLPFAIMPFAATALLNVCRCYMPFLQKLPGFLNRLIVPRALFLLTEEGSQMVMAFAAVSEVIVAAMSPLVVIAQGFRAAILVFFYFQYVARKHASNFWTKQAVTALNDKLTGIFHHRWCPGPVGIVFDRIKGLVALAAAKIQ